MTPLPPDALQSAIEAHRAGDLVAARTGYEAVLRDDPENVDALHLLGLIAVRDGQIEAGVTLIRAALAVAPAFPTALRNLGTVLVQTGHEDDGIDAYIRAAEAAPPQDAGFQTAMGLELQARGRLAEARTCLRRARDAAPDQPAPHANFGAVLLDQNEPAAALAHLDQALALNPRLVEVHVNRAAALHALRRLAEAEAACRTALALDPNRLITRMRLAAILAEQDRPAEFAANASAMAPQDPTSAAQHVVVGTARLDDLLPDAAAESFQTALALDPDRVEAHFGLGNAARSRNRVAEAVGHFDTALRLRPDLFEAEANAAMALLLDGDFAAGWQRYESRWHTGQLTAPVPPPDAAAFTGAEALAGRHILLQAEQGLGDTIQLARYASVLAAGGARVTLEVAPGLVGLLASVPGVAAVIARGTPLPPADLAAPLFSLPLACATRLDTIPADIPYLAPPAQRIAVWHARLAPYADRPRIGLSWSGNPAFTNDRNRSLRLARLAGLVQAHAGRLHFFMAQRDLQPADQTAFDALAPLFDVRAYLTDFCETAALLQQMDLVLTVDTTIAHLAGALGRPCWVMLPFSPDFRWLLGRDDSPWYPSVRLFRQTAPGDWDGVLARVSAALDELG